MIQPPRTYSEWVNVLAVFKDRTNDSEVLTAMRSGTIEWQSGVAERFSKKLIDSFNFRMNAATDKFQKEISRSQGRESDIVQAILSLRKEFRFLAEAIDLPALPERERKHYAGLIAEQADLIQRSLEDSAKKDRSGKLSSIVRNHKVNAL